MTMHRLNGVHITITVAYSAWPSEAMKLPVLAQIAGRCDLGQRDLHGNSGRKLVASQASINTSLAIPHEHNQANKSSVDEINDL